MLVLALAAAMLAPQDPPPAAPQAAEPPIRLEDVVIERQRLEDLTRDFVAEVAAPARRRGLARWHRNVCVGVINLRADAAHYMADRISAVALDLGLEAGEPGCRPNVVIVGASDGAALATALVEARRRNFDLGAGATDRGSRALREFQTGDRPIRWWQTSMPVDSETDQRAIRLPGDLDPSTGKPSAPMIELTATSRLHSQIRDGMVRSLIIVDVNQLGDATFTQLTDYVVMLALAQIDADADPAPYETILNLFGGGTPPDGLTSWDMTYLRALYAAEPTRVDPRSQADMIARIMTRERRAAEAGEAD